MVKRLGTTLALAAALAFGATAAPAQAQTTDPGPGWTQYCPWWMTQINTPWGPYCVSPIRPY